MLMTLPKSLQQHITEFDSVLTGLAVSEEDVFFKKIKYSSKISSKLAIEIYINNTRGARVNALKTVYPACGNILGKDVFHSIAKEFVDADVAGLQDLNNYGAAFGQHLSSLVETGRLPAEYSYLHDLAHLELQIHTAYYVEDDPVFDFKVLEDRIKNGSQLHFRLSKSLALLVFQMPILEIWKNNLDTTVCGDSSVLAITETQYLLIHREVNIPVVTMINACEYKLLDAIKNNLSLQDAIVSVDCDIDRILPKLILKKWVCGVT